VAGGLHVRAALEAELLPLLDVRIRVERLVHAARREHERRARLGLGGELAVLEAEAAEAALHDVVVVARAVLVQHLTEELQCAVLVAVGAVQQ